MLFGFELITSQIYKKVKEYKEFLTFYHKIKQKKWVKLSPHPS